MKGMTMGMTNMMRIRKLICGFHTLSLICQILG